MQGADICPQGLTCHRLFARRNSGSTHTRSDVPQELKELIASYQTLRESGRGPAICNTIIETARQCNLDKDIKLPEGDAKDLDLAQRDSLVGQAYSRYHLIIPRYRTPGTFQ